MLKSSLVISGISLIGSGLGLMVQVLLAREFGAGVDVDAYLFATALPTFIAGSFAATFSYSLVPKIAGFNAGLDERRRFIGAMILATLGLALVSTVAGMMLIGAQLSLLPDVSPVRSATDLKAMMFAGWMLCGIQIILGCMVAILNGTGRFLSAAFLSLAPYLGILAVLSVSSKDSALALPVGMLLGSAAASLFAIVRIHGEMEFFRPASMPWRRVFEFISTAPYNILAISCFSAYVVIDSYWAPKAGTGVFSNLGYAQRLIIAIGNLAVIGPYTLIGPHLASILALKDMDAFRRVTLHSLVLVFTVGVFLAIAIGLAAEPAIRFLFSRGAFGDEEVKVLASTVRHMAPGMVGMVLTATLLKVLFVLPDSGPSAAAVGISWPVIYFALSGLWIETGSFGIAMAYSVSWCFITALYTGILILRIKRC